MTFQRNVVDRDELDAHLVDLARRVADDVHEEGRPVARVGVKVRFAPFFTHTRSVTLAAPTMDPAVIEQGARSRNSLGQQTDEVLSEWLGWTADKMTRSAACGAFGRSKAHKDAAR